MERPRDRGRRAGLDTDALAERRAKYQPAFAGILDVLAANPGIPVSSGGFETVLRVRVTAFIDGLSHALANIERCGALFDLCVCRDHGVFHDLSMVADALRADVENTDGHRPRASSLTRSRPTRPPTPRCATATFPSTPRSTPLHHHHRR